ncbi:MAG: response regulator [bacterium]|nr:response regulator [bacterium]
MAFTILVVEDDHDFQTLISMALRRAGLQALVVGSAGEALHALKDRAFDAIILDDMLPGMSGADLCLMLKRDPHYSAVPILFYTAGARFNIEEVPHRLGADAALIKNGRMNEMVQTLVRLLSAGVA